MISERVNNITLFSFRVFKPFGYVKSVTTCRDGGVSSGVYQSLNLGENTFDNQQDVFKNIELIRQLVIQKYGVDKMILPKQVHGNKVMNIDNTYLKNSECFRVEPECDALITSVRNVFIGIRTADCVPVSVLDPDNKTIAVIHAGWRGIVNGVIKKTIELLSLSGSANSFIAGIGPAIESDVYEVGNEVAESIGEVLPTGKVCFKKGSKTYLDLKGAVRYQLKECGIIDPNIETSEFCTWRNDDLFYSYRKFKGNTGRFLTGMVLTI